jgi:two-component system sensor histidine kinase KdpD
MGFAMTLQSTTSLELLREALPAVCSGEWDRAASVLARDPGAVNRDAACLNLIGVVCQAKGRHGRARRFYGKAMRADRHFGPAAQNMQRLYELNTFGRTKLPIALSDAATLMRVRSLPKSARDDANVRSPVSLWITPDATMESVNRRYDWAGYAWALAVVALATLIGFPLVHSPYLHLDNANVLMLYLLGVLWVATHCSRGAAILASVLGVAVFDFVFVQPYYTFAVADRQYIFTFGVMLLTALVISTLTHRVRQQSALAKQAWERVETEFLRNTLLSGVSHELRTPLSAISGAASGLSETGASLSPQTRAELLEIIRSEADRMERLIVNLLDMTRLESGGLVVKKEPVPLEELIGSAMNPMQRRLGDRQVNIQLSDDLPMVNVDAVLMGQVFANLIDNAIEYSPAASPLDLSAHATASGEDVVIEFADRGPGLPAGAETRIFEKFFRAHSGENRRGVGLGLAIVRGIAEAHGGRVQASNRDGGGAVFRVTLPSAPPTPELDRSE